MLALVLVELGLSARRPGPPTTTSSARWAAVWIGVAAAFGILLGLTRGSSHGLAFFAAYLTEESLSLDNMVVFVAVFGFFAVPVAYEQRILFWGILGAIALRGLMIAAGVELLNRVEWITYVFGGFLVVGGLRLLRPPSESAPGGTNIMRWVGRLVPVTPSIDSDAFFTRVDGRRAVTPLFVALVVIELSDVVFATDSIPAVFGVTRDPFIVYTSNLLAVLGMRSLYFVVADFLPRLRYLRYGLAFILTFVGTKMLAASVIEVSVGMSLIVLVLAIGVTTAASLLRPAPFRPRGL